MSKSALLIGRDRAIQVLGPFGSQPEVPKRLTLPRPLHDMISLAKEDTPVTPPRNRPPTPPSRAEGSR
jgi:hypothetical protein